MLILSTAVSEGPLTRLLPKRVEDEMVIAGIPAG
jgi:hypothetical protein